MECCNDSHGDLVVQCECGNTWLLDYEPPPDCCEGSIWRLGIFHSEEEEIDWSSWVDQEGNHISMEELNK